MLLVVDSTCYIANVGDSRAVMSKSKGRSVVALTKDHKPDDEQEQRRIISNGGSVYRYYIAEDFILTIELLIHK